MIIQKTTAMTFIPQVPKMLTTAWVGVESDVHQQLQAEVRTSEEHSQ
jgi:hypothetical protein